MSKSDIEREMTSAKSLLEQTGKALQNSTDPILKKLAREAKEAARDLERARDKMHSDWEED